MKEDAVDKGCYCLIVHVKQDCRIKIGAMGMSNFRKGHYVYVGSALNGLESRVSRHISKDKKVHWHMDYLSLNKNAKIVQVIYTHCDKKIECDMSRQINENAIDYIEDFGCSDCKCMSHLYYFDSYDEAENVSADAIKKLGYKAHKWM
ncbi:MAG: endonuclease [Methanosphaera sp. rholeuAM130]|nr:GIY-YIG nuclease family protein [Methanosphaera sp.]RAP52546.1 MAG: endonuclease [Methanosphaera sp. rholeuAM130]